MKQTLNARTRCEMLAEYMIETGTTVRGAAFRFGISKSTVHKDLTDRLKSVRPGLYREVKEILEKNKSERHLRGGEATKRKYESIRFQKERKTVEIAQTETKKSGK